MKMLWRILLLTVVVLALFSCGPKKKPVDPIEPSQPPQAEQPVETPAPEPPSPAPEEPKPGPQPPQPAPRQPAKGDTASSKVVENGVKQMNAGNFDAAEQLFEQALRVSPTNGKPYYYLGVLAAKEKQFERSLGFLEQAETYLKDDDFWMSQVFLQEGLSLKGLGRKDEARSKLKEALQRDPTNQWAQTELNKL